MQGQMYDPTIQVALLRKLAQWRRLPEEDLVAMLTPVERLRFRPDALRDLALDGLVTVTPAGDEPMVMITDAGEAFLRGGG